MIIVTPSKLSPISNLMIVSVFLLSKSPVGSSKRRMDGEFTSALAMVTRCCSPQIAEMGNDPNDHPYPRWSKRRAFAFASAVAVPFFSSVGSITFSNAVMEPIKLNVWKTNPKC